MLSKRLFLSAVFDGSRADTSMTDLGSKCFCCTLGGFESAGTLGSFASGSTIVGVVVVNGCVLPNCSASCCNAFLTGSPASSEGYVVDGGLVKRCTRSDAVCRK